MIVDSRPPLCLAFLAIDCPFIILSLPTLPQSLASHPLRVTASINSNVHLTPSPSPPLNTPLLHPFTLPSYLSPHLPLPLSGAASINSNVSGLAPAQSDTDGEEELHIIPKDHHRGYDR